MRWFYTDHYRQGVMLWYGDKPPRYYGERGYSGDGGCRGCDSTLTGAVPESETGPDGAELVELHMEFSFLAVLRTKEGKPNIDWQKVWIEFNKKKLAIEEHCDQCGSSTSEFTMNDEAAILQKLVEEQLK